MRIDAHQHYWQLGRSDYAWMQPQHAAIRRDFMPPDLAPLLTAAGIHGTILVQADATARETVEIAGVTPSVLAVVGWIDFTAADAVAGGERPAGQAKLRGCGRWWNSSTTPTGSCSRLSIRFSGR